MIDLDDFQRLIDGQAAAGQAPVKSEPAVAVSSAQLDGLVGSMVALKGRAANAHAGAVLLTDDRTPVYVAGLEAWPDATNNAQIELRGQLAHRAIVPLASVDAQGGVSHGLASAVYVVEDAEWGLASP